MDGKRVNRKGSKDESGKLFTTQRAALQAKAIAELRFDAEQHQNPKRRMTFGEVYAEYCQQGRSGKAYTTIRKQDKKEKERSFFRNFHLDFPLQIGYTMSATQTE